MRKWTVKGAPRARGPARPHAPGARYYGGPRPHRSFFPPRGITNPAEYVREFNRLNNLKD